MAGAKQANVAVTIQSGIRVVIASVMLAILYLVKNRRWRPRGCAHVPGHWLLGNLPAYAAAMKDFKHNEFLLECFRKYGQTIYIDLPGQVTLFQTINPANVEHILKTRFDNYIKGSYFRNRLTDLLGDGIFNVDGDLWHHQRKVSSRMFTQNKFKDHIWRVVKRNCAKVSQLLRSTPPGTVVDIFNIMNRFTLDTIGEVGFGRDIGSLENADSPFLKSFDRTQQICVQRFVFPLWELKRFLGIGDEGEGARHFKLLASYSREIVQNLKSNLSGEAAESFVGIFMLDAEEKGEAYDEKMMQDMVVNFLLAGRDTTAQSLSWTFFLLAGHPEVEKKARDEIAQVCGDKELDFEDTKQLPYIKAILNESLRLYPSVPSDPKIAVSDDVLPDGTHVPKGSVIGIQNFCMGRSEKIWGDDAEEFRPERWIGADPYNPYHFPVFLAGPRECLGKRLAMIEMTSCVVEMLRAVKLTLAVPRDEIKPDVQLTLGMSSGLPCTVEAL